MFCKNCGTEIGQNVETCPKCGKSQFQENKPMNKKKLIIAIIAVILVIAIVVGTVIIISSKKDDSEDHPEVSPSEKTSEVTNEPSTQINQKKIDMIYNKNKSNYDLVDFRIYEAENQDDASSFLSAVTDEKSFIAEAAKRNENNPYYDADYDTKMVAILKAEVANLSEDCAEWLFDEETNIGDSKIFTSKNGITYYVIMITATPHQVDTVSVRHILFLTMDMNTGIEFSEAEVAEKKKEAEDALKRWQEGDKTSESFATLATELTEDTGSKFTGGLYENIRPGQMIKEFDAWIFAKNRKPGDTAIVETDYGYHVIYFEKDDGKYYEAVIKEHHLK